MKLLRSGPTGAERPGLLDSAGAVREKPPIWLQPGDIVELGIEGLGRQRQPVVAELG